MDNQLGGCNVCHSFLINKHNSNAHLLMNYIYYISGSGYEYVPIFEQQRDERMHEISWSETIR